MNVSDFDFELPAELIAQQPALRRDAARLLVLDRSTGAVDHRTFRELGRSLRPGDLLVLNDTRVVPACLLGRKASGGRVELLLLERLEASGREAVWRCLLRASRPPGAGAVLHFPEALRGDVVEREDDAWRVRLTCDAGELDERIERVGRPPLPPYIRRADDAPLAADRQRYQTVYARRPGAIAAPTAGLHFTVELLSDLEARGVEFAWVTLHVGRGTFLPVAAERVEDHRMHPEAFELPEATARAVAATRQRGGRVVAVGTTVVRTLEERATEGGLVTPGRGRSALFIYPGFHFRVVDAMITNFHLPRSTLLMLASAFAGRERLLEAYRQAIARGYRFYSYGDAMWISDAA
jgi:S-adenosylmethionine:tRNA ribosyltransferase-isomerase